METNMNTTRQQHENGGTDHHRSVSPTEDNLKGETLPTYSKRELYIVCHDDQKGYIDVSPDDTLSDVRRLVLDEFDLDMFPSDVEKESFFFCVKGIRVQKKQEGRKRVWDLATGTPNDVYVSLHYRQSQEDRSSNNKRLRENTDDGVSNDNATKPTKQLRREEASPPSTAPLQQIHQKNKGEIHETPLEARKLQLDPPSTSGRSTTANKAADDFDADIANHSNNDENDSTDTFLPSASPDEDDDQDDVVVSSEYAITSAHDHRKSSMSVEKADNNVKSGVRSVTTNDEALSPNFKSDEKGESSATKKAVKRIMSAQEPDSNLSKEPSLNVLRSEESHDKNNTDALHGERTLQDVGDKTEAHQIQDQAMKESTNVLKEIETVLKENPMFCSEDRRLDWTAEIQETLEKSAPDTIIGVLGATGVGKSSLLNALLDEASILPTSGSRGCTATVVELRFNKELVKSSSSADTPVPVYTGEVEFITLQEWTAELKVLMSECCTNDEKKVYANAPDEDRQPDAAAAWSKIDQVYGRGTMAGYRGRRMQDVLSILSQNRRIVQLLTPASDGSGRMNKAVLVKEGEIASDKASALLKGYVKTNARLRRSKKKWAEAFRGKINDYVYRHGNGDSPQTWPLIRKVVLKGPWPVLSTGACLVDLPGVKDANAARAKVAERYLQNCGEIWIVASIKRAVDDGTAKELLGEQFKRRLLMDGQYGNVKFICTQTDDCETTEIMRDHEDVAMQEEGRWEIMKSLDDEIKSMEKDYSDLVQEREDLHFVLEEAQDELNEAKFQQEEATEEGEEDLDELELLQNAVVRSREVVSAARDHIQTWEITNNAKTQKMQQIIQVKQRRLKTMCAKIRNEYSKGCLQSDFRAGLKELFRKSDDENDNMNGSDTQEKDTAGIPLPDDFQMDVFAISSNDYLKITGIKPSSDGLPNTFSKSDDTQIPALRSSVHVTTANQQRKFIESFVSEVGDMVDRVKLLASDASSVPSSRVSRRCQSMFEGEMDKLTKLVKEAADVFSQQAQTKVQRSLVPNLKIGAEKGRSNALSVVQSWGSGQVRNKHERRPNMNAVKYPTYAATVRRDGCYYSCSAGQVDFNQELCDPMEKEFGVHWQETMDTAFRVLLNALEKNISSLCDASNKALFSGLVGAGMDKDRLQAIASTASRTALTSVKNTFYSMQGFATNTQRDLNRSLLPLVQARMRGGYERALEVPRGTGVFNRMKSAIGSHSHYAVHTMFDESTNELVKAIDDMIHKLCLQAREVAKTVSRALSGVYSVCWEEQRCTTVMDPVEQAKMQACRNELLPVFNKICQRQRDNMKLVGIVREELELDVMAVASLETRIEERFNEAERRGEVIDLCDDNNLDWMNSKSSTLTDVKPVAQPHRVKAEQGLASVFCPMVVSVNNASYF